MRLSAARRVFVAALVAVVAVGTAVTIGGGDDRRAADPVVAPATESRMSGPELAGSLSLTSPVRTSAATFDAETLSRVRAQDVETERAWPLEIPGDPRTAWLFAGVDRIALLVPRTVIDPDRGPQSDATSLFGARSADLVDQPLVASQVGGGQQPRILVLVPNGVEPPRIVARGGDVPIREMARRGRFYVDRIRAGEELVVGARRIGPTGSG